MVIRIHRQWICCALAIIFLVIAASSPCWYRKPIESATYDELVSLSGIGDTRAMLVLKSGADDVDDLYKIDGIGEKTVWVLKQKYR